MITPRLPVTRFDAELAFRRYVIAYVSPGAFSIDDDDIA